MKFHKIATFVGFVFFEKKTSAFQFNTSLKEFSSSFDILHFRGSTPSRTGLVAANSAFVGLSGKLEQRDSQSSVTDLEDSISTILFINFFVGM